MTKDFTRASRRFTVLPLVLMLGACAFAPDSKPPEVTPPAVKIISPHQISHAVVERIGVILSKLRLRTSVHGHCLLTASQALRRYSSYSQLPLPPV